MTSTPLLAQQTFDSLLQEMSTRITLVSRQCHTLGNMLVTLDPNHQNFFAIGQKYEGYGLESVSAMESSQYMSTLLADRIGAFLTPLNLMLDMLDTIASEIRLTTLSAEQKASVQEVLDSICYEFGEIVNKERQLTHIAAKLSPPTKIWER